MGEPKVTIVTPTLNQAAYIRETIDSVLAQDYPIQYIVQDGGSTDGTLDILHSYGSKILWETAHDSGQASAINRAMGAATGEILHWLNSDDTLLSGAVQKAVSGIQENAVGVIFGDCLIVDETGHYLYQTRYSDTDPWAFVDDLFQEAKNPIPQPAAFIHRDAWQRLDESLHYFLDWDLWLKVAMKFRVAHVPEVLATYRLHPESKTGRAQYPSHELEAIYDRLPEFVFHPKGKRAAMANVYRRMAEYESAGGHHLRALKLKGKAWLKGM